MPFLLPCEPGRRRAVDPAWAGEADLLARMGEQVFLADHDILCGGDAREALRRSGLSEAPPSTLAWRGWMMPSDAYADLEAEAARLGHAMLDAAAAYRRAHHAEGAADALSALMPPTWFARADDRAGLERLLLSLEGRPLVLKDQVKSEAALWLEACFIPEPGDLRASFRVIDRFVALRDRFLVGELAFKAFLPLLGDGPGRAWEWRAFVVDGRVASILPRQDAAPRGMAPPRDEVDRAARLLRARWWAMDWACTEDGEWVVVEAGWGGVSSCPPPALAPMLGAVSEALKPGPA